MFRVHARHIYKMCTFNRFIVLAVQLTILAACSPEIKIHATDKPIVINLNIKIEQEVRIKIEKDIDDLFRNNKDLF